MAEPDEDLQDQLMTPREVARLFGVNPKTVTRWAETGKLRGMRTLGGHRRYRASEVYRRLRENAAPDLSGSASITNPPGPGS